MDTRPFLYLCVRPQRDAGAAEHASFAAAAGLTAESLHAHDLVRESLPALDDYAGVMVGGSPFNVTDPSPTDAQRAVEGALERVAASGRPVFFTCYGIGVVTRMLGGSVTRDHGEGTGAVTVTLTAAGAADPVTGSVPRRFEAFTAHKEGSAEVPPGAELLATSEACPVQAYRLGGHLYATQFHPESTPDAFAARMGLYRDAGYFPSSEYDALAAGVLAASVTEPGRMLRAFIDRFTA